MTLIWCSEYHLAQSLSVQDQITPRRLVCFEEQHRPDLGGAEQIFNECTLTREPLPALYPSLKSWMLLDFGTLSDMGECQDDGTISNVR